MEALCNPMSVQPLETVNLCLKALDTLLDDPWTRAHLGSDQVLTIELLNVLHRSHTFINSQLYCVHLLLITGLYRNEQESLVVKSESTWLLMRFGFFCLYYFQLLPISSSLIWSIQMDLKHQQLLLLCFFQTAFDERLR